MLYNLEKPIQKVQVEKGEFSILLNKKKNTVFFTFTKQINTVKTPAQIHVRAQAPAISATLPNYYLHVITSRSPSRFSTLSLCMLGYLVRFQIPFIGLQTLAHLISVSVGAFRKKKLGTRETLGHKYLTYRCR